jgi:hypothetical protein
MRLCLGEPAKQYGEEDARYAWNSDNGKQFLDFESFTYKVLSYSIIVDYYR